MPQGTVGWLESLLVFREVPFRYSAQTGTCMSQVAHAQVSLFGKSPSGIEWGAEAHQYKSIARTRWRV
jgi:hypothetical protein